VKIGTLIQPWVTVKWGDLSLTPFEGLFNAIASIEISLYDSDQGPSGSIKFRNDVIGYRAYRQCISRAQDDIKIQFGYDNGPTTPEFTLVYSSATIDTGLSQDISVELSSKANYEIKNVRGTSILNSNDQDSTLSEIIETARNRLGVDTKVIYPDYFKNTKARQSYIIGDSFKDFVQRLAKDSGHAIQILSSQNNTIEIIEPSKTESRKNPPKNPPKKGERKETEKFGYILGPGLINSFSRTSRFNKPSETRGTTGTSSETNGLRETDLINNNQLPERKDPKAERINQLEQTNRSNTVLNSKTTSVTAQNLTEDGDKSKNLRKEKSETQELTASGEVFMVPYITGIVPRDFIFLTSLTGDYIEDWYITQVTYSFSGGGVNLALSCKRTDDNNGSIAPNKQEFLNLSKKLDTPKKWNNFYWSNNA